MKVTPKWDDDQLRWEAALIHRAAFGRDVPPEVVRRYAEAHGLSLLECEPSERAWLRRLRDAGADLEALEVALRSRRPNHVLCNKFRLLLYIAEAYPEYYDDFINDDRRPLRAILALGVHGLRAVAKRVKGEWLLTRLF